MTSASSLSPLALWDTVHVITDCDTGRCKGFGFVEMPDCQAAQAACTGGSALADPSRGKCCSTEGVGMHAERQCEVSLP